MSDVFSIFNYYLESVSILNKYFVSKCRLSVTEHLLRINILITEAVYKHFYSARMWIWADGMQQWGEMCSIELEM